MTNALFAVIAMAGLALGIAGPEDEKKAHCPLCASKASADGEKSAHAKSLESVSADDYASVTWPSHNKDLYAKDFQGKSLPVALGEETWVTKEVETEGRVMILDFWATWCPPCVAASPILDKLQTDHKDDLVVMAIGGQSEDEDTIRSYVDEHEVSYSHVFDADQTVFKPFESSGIPLVVVLSTDGVVRWMGNPHDKAFTKAVESVIKNDPAIQARKKG